MDAPEQAAAEVVAVNKEEQSFSGSSTGSQNDFFGNDASCFDFVSNDTYELEQTEEFDGKWWPTREQIDQIEIPQDATFAAPKANEWRETPGEIHLSVNRARTEEWTRCKREINTL